MAIQASAQEPASPGTDPMALLMSGQYAELDRVMQGVQDSYKKGSATDEQLLAAFRPFYQVSDPAQAQHFDAWVHQKPRSYVARLARGIHYKYIGLIARGSETLDKVPDASLWTREEAYAKATDDLRASLDLDEKPLLSYQHLIDPSGSLLWFTSNRSLLDKANAVDPGNLIVRRKFLNTLPARWGGSLAKMEAFVQECREAGLPPAHIRKLEAVITAEHGWSAYFRDHNSARAEALYAEALAADPESVSAAEMYLSALMDRRKCDEAIPAASRLLEQDPGNWLALGNRGVCYVRQHQEALGVSDYRTAAALGDPWANKELARLHWQGLMVPKDRTLALKLLRRSAESGDADAQRELKRVTGENVVTQRSSWFAVVPFAALAIVLGAVGSWAVGVRSRVAPEVAARRLSYPLNTYVTGALCFGFCIALIIASKMYPNRTENLLTTLGFLAFAVAALPYMIGYLLVQHEVTEDGLIYTRLGRSRGRLKWADVRRVSYSARLKHFTVEPGTGAVARISVKLLNLPVFAREVLARVPPGAIEPKAAALLEGEREPEDTIDWADADIAAQHSARSSCIVLPGGTDVARVALFSLDALPPGKSVDPAALERMERDGLAVCVDTHADGGYLMHLYVDVPVPPVVLKYCPPEDGKTAFLRTSTGRVAFGGTESICAEFAPNSNIRTDAQIPAGEYDATVYLTDYPDEMIGTAMHGSDGQRDSLWVRVPPIAIMVGVLAAFIAFLLHFWWWAGGLLALAVVSGKLFYGGANRKESRQRSEEAALSFPSVVAHLTTRKSH